MNKRAQSREQIIVGMQNNISQIFSIPIFSIVFGVINF